MKKQKRRIKKHATELVKSWILQLQRGSSFICLLCFMAIQPSPITFLTEDQTTVTKMYLVVCTCGIGYVNITNLLLI